MQWPTEQTKNCSTSSRDPLGWQQSYRERDTYRPRERERARGPWQGKDLCRHSNSGLWMPGIGLQLTCSSQDTALTSPTHCLNRPDPTGNNTTVCQLAITRAILSHFHRFLYISIGVLSREKKGKNQKVADRNLLKRVETTPYSWRQRIVSVLHNAFLSERSVTSHPPEPSPEQHGW